jgi:lipoprotein-releasing system permease protein
MNLSYFISKRIRHHEPGGFGSTVHKIAIITIGVGLGAAIISFLIMRGFQAAVKNKIYGFSGHLLINRLTLNNSLEETPMDINMELFRNYRQFKGIRHMQEYAHKAGLIKTDDAVLGVLLKGVGRTYDTLMFHSNMVEGRFIQFPDSGYSGEVLISRLIAEKLNITVGDQIMVHFFQNPPRFRKLRVVGLYETNLSEYFDSKVILCDIRLIARLNDWADSIAGGIEVFLSDEVYAEKIEAQLSEMIDYDLNIYSVKDKYIQVFEWLQLLSRQVNILLVIILSVICVNMISIILILVMERTQMIGVLKALGATNAFIRWIFIYHGARLLGRGMLLGNFIGLGFCFVQHRFRIIELNPKDYYMSYVPVGWDWPLVIILNLITFLVVAVVLMVPTALVSRIQPIKAIRFD